jgi:uncharacterized membrane protein YphA (DoxX/SURF4 family)
MWMDRGLFAARWMVGGVLLIAGLAKIRSGAGPFLKAILGYDLLPRPVAVILATVLPWLEVLAGGLLLAGLWTQIAALLGFALLLLFAAAVAVSLLRGKRHECGCFGSPAPVQWRLVYRNLGLTMLLLPIHA